MSYKFVWHSEGPNACFRCTQWEGQIFSSAEALPELPVHKNCKCYVRAFDSNSHNFNNAIKHLSSLIEESSELLSNLQPLLHIEPLKRFWSDINTSIYALEQVLKAAQIFWKNFNDMKEANFKGADRYFHSKANAQAAQLGEIGEHTATLISESREFIDYYKYLIKDIILLRTMTHSFLVEDIQQDKKANAHRRKAGRQNPASDIEFDIRIYRPKGMPWKN